MVSPLYLCMAANKIVRRQSWDPPARWPISVVADIDVKRPNRYATRKERAQTMICGQKPNEVKACNGHLQ